MRHLRFAVVLIVLVACRARVAAPRDAVVRVVVLGDSVAHGAGDESGLGIAGRLDRELRARGFPFAPTANLGINGARTYNVLRLLRSGTARSVIGAANVVILSIGGNDLYGDSIARLITLAAPQLAIHRVASRVATVVRQIQRINPTARIVLLGLYNPYRGAQFLDKEVNDWDARLIGTFAADRTVTVERIADLFQSTGRLSSLDHFHPSAAGYALIAARIAPTIQ